MSLLPLDFNLCRIWVLYIFLSNVGDLSVKVLHERNPDFPLPDHMKPVLEFDCAIQNIFDCANMYESFLPRVAKVLYSSCCHSFSPFLSVIILRLLHSSLFLVSINLAENHPKCNYSTSAFAEFRNCRVLLQHGESRLLQSTSISSAGVSSTSPAEICD